MPYTNIGAFILRKFKFFIRINPKLIKNRLRGHAYIQGL